MSQGHWTDEQWQAIITREQDILVAAAAGSGKTAVLVERIIRRITEANNSIDVDQLLVVTFTNASAAEMRHRIADRLEKALKETPDSNKLQRQLALLNKAAISTLHSFCLDIVRKYYYLIDIDPNFRIADDTEAALMREEILEEVLESYYADEQNVNFIRLADCYADDRSDVALQTMILKLYDYSRSHPAPETWLNQVAANYCIDGVSTIDELPWVADFMGDIRLQLQGVRCILEKALEITLQPLGPAPYKDNINMDLEQIEYIYGAAKETWEATYEAFNELSFSRLKACKKDSCDKNLQEQVKDLREQAKKKLKGLKEATFTRSPEAYLQDIGEMAPIIGELVNVVKTFARQYQLAKMNKGLVDFADLEHYCLEILTDAQTTASGNMLVPSVAAKQLQKQFAEILIDEYQDTNLVQESILNLLQSDGNYRFMVGDVKQSVYRFRLAEPELFLSKYKSFQSNSNTSDSNQNDSNQSESSQSNNIQTGGQHSLRIDLAKNFRSRQEVIHSTNFIFKQIMDETVGEIPYDEKAQLEYGATYYPEQDCRAELLLIDRLQTNDKQDEEVDETNDKFDDVYQVTDQDIDQDEQRGVSTSTVDEDVEDLEVVQLEARVIAQQIHDLIGKGDKPSYKIFDKNQDEAQPMRNIRFRDIVILLRATANWAPVIIDELKQQGIPAYAELASGYFSATEVTVMMSLLKIIDNPYQDIPLAAVLRSPIVGLSGEELACVRIANKKAPFYEALKAYIDSSAHIKLQEFYNQLQTWRTRARQGALSDLIWQLYRETGYYNFVGGMVAGNQRQANLRALYDRARAYEKTSFRGLFRFLNFIERMQERGGDLGTARAIGEQEDVVRIMTIHKSKGLEFPVVFVAGLGKQFNFQDIRGKYLVHKKLGFGTIYVNPEQRVSYPLLPQLAIRQRVKMEQLAEEMRILYVALTRAKEKLFLVGSLKGLEKEVNKWGQHIALQDWILPDYERAGGKTYLDWIGPAVIRHREAGSLQQHLPGCCNDFQEQIFEQILKHKASWKITTYNIEDLVKANKELTEGDQAYSESIKALQPVPVSSDYREQVIRRLEWGYPQDMATQHLAKQSVSEIKRNSMHSELYNQHSSTNMLLDNKQSVVIERPNFMQDKKLTASERGTIIHLFMQHVDLSVEVTIDSLRKQSKWMEDNEFATAEQLQEVDLNDIAAFFKTDIGVRLNKATVVQREIPFSLALLANEIYSDWRCEKDRTQNADYIDSIEHVLIQGVIDCVFEDEGGLVLLDYKTDRIHKLSNQDLANRYKLQIELYTKAIEQIWKRTLQEKYLYFFNGMRIVKA
ncbi:helicase-exonuclease AddAB subunit AddA [Desulfuribacillus alkaliarsenatis]|uniref:ATP-dependent helicase/nuclease subunit A n=1 Tax=Desulfuribacillus alkaliarsenatis TaxID=766136 RepID=A0A1E5G1D4_9FIRM|nr:helicase-exonuclease AddAB subunit AddA [Desulfuribacillus alkaliarsenatis]OEF96705.1 helicase-exonuclease AddAB subunit AddA [Desulfuribacillus alkaliarsenatis]